MSDVKVTRFVVTLPETVDLCGVMLTVRTLSRQIYPHWKIVLPNMINQDIKDLVIAFVPRDRVKFGDIGNYNYNCDYVLHLIPGDVLTEDCLAEFAVAAKGGNPHLIYSDHVEVSSSAKKQAIFKASWSPETLVVKNYIRRAAIASQLAENTALGPQYTEDSLWEIWLHMARQQDGVSVINAERILFELPAISASLSSIATGVKIINRHLRSLRVSGTAIWPGWARKRKLRIFDLEFPSDGPEVAIIIPTKNNEKMLRRCVDSIKRKTSYRNYSIFVINNESDDPSTLAYLRQIEETVTIIDIPSPPGGFSYSYINNKAVEYITAPYLLFLNDDTEVIAPAWLSNMVGWMQFPMVATVGARLLFPDGTIQHAGLAHRLLGGSLPAPLFKLFPAEATEGDGIDKTVGNYSALTAACLLTPRDRFTRQGGFDDVHFRVAYNDCDYGFSLSQAGFRHVYVPSAELYHFEGATRGSGVGNDKPSEEANFIQKYRAWKDPHYNSNLSVRTLWRDVGVQSSVSPYYNWGTLNVVLVTHNLNFEGAPLVLRDVAVGLHAVGFKVTIFSLIDGPLRALYEEIGIKVIVRSNIGIFGARNEIDFARWINEVKRAFAELQADVIIGNTVISHWAVAAAQGMGIPFLWIIHESEPPFTHLQSLGAVHMSAAADAFRESYCNVFVCEATLKVYEDLHNNENVQVIYNGFDKEVFGRLVKEYNRDEERDRLKIGKEDIVFFMPGTVCERKAQIDLFDALQMVPYAISQRIIVLIVGDRVNEYSRSMHDNYTKLKQNLRSRVRIIPETPEIHRYYAVSDVLAFTSHCESFPRAIQEAMCLGMPILTTPVFGITEQVRSNQSAIFFDPGDCGALAQAMEKCATDSNLRTRLGLEAESALGRFPTIPEMQSEYVALIRKAYISRDFKRVNDPWLK